MQGYDFNPSKVTIMDIEIHKEKCNTWLTRLEILHQCTTFILNFHGIQVTILFPISAISFNSHFSCKQYLQCKIPRQFLVMNSICHILQKPTNISSCFFGSFLLTFCLILQIFCCIYFPSSGNMNNK